MNKYFAAVAVTAMAGLPLAFTGSAAHAVTVTGTGTSTFTNLANCGGGNCQITTSSGNPQVQWGSTNLFFNLVNPSTLTAPASLPFTGNTNTTLTIGQLSWFNNATLSSQTDPNFNVNWNLTVAFTAPPGSTGDTETFALNILSTTNPPGDVIAGLTLADLSGLSFSLPNVTVSNFQYHVTDGPGTGTTSLSCTAGNCRWNNNEQNNATLTITANFAAVPEPASLALIGTGLFGLGMIRRRRSRATT